MTKCIITPASIPRRQSTNVMRGNVQQMADTLYEDMSFLAGMVGMNPDDFMAENVLSKGEKQFSKYTLEAGKEYILVAFGCNPDGKTTTKTFTSLKVNTPEMVMTGLTVDFTVDAPTNDVILTATPSDKTIRYYVSVKEADETIDIQDEINTLIWRGGIAEKTPEQVVQEITYVGDARIEKSLDPEKEYNVYACSVTPDGVVNSELSIKKFVTGKVAPSNNTFTITVTNISSRGADINVVPTNEDTYSVGVLPASEFEGKTDQEVLDKYVSENAMTVDWYTRSGNFTYPWNLSNDTEYVAFVFGTSHGVATTAMTKTTFKTLAPSDPKTWEATFGDVVIDGKNAKVKINVNHDDVQYLWNVVDATGTDEQVKEALLREYKRCQDKGFNYVEMYGVYGSNEVTFEAMEPGGEYKFFAVVMNPQTTELETPIFYSVHFTQDGMVKSAAPSKAPMKAEAEAPLKLRVEKTMKK